jgi:hypothetical protein
MKKGSSLTVRLRMKPDRSDHVTAAQKPRSAVEAAAPLLDWLRGGMLSASSQASGGASVLSHAVEQRLVAELSKLDQVIVFDTVFRLNFDQKSVSCMIIRTRPFFGILAVSIFRWNLIFRF